MTITRRTLLLGGAGAAACSRGPDYETAAEALWSPRPSGDLEALVS